MSKSKSGGKSGPSTPMTPTAASRVQSATAKANGGQVNAGTFAARAQSAAVKNTGSGQTSKK